MKQYCRYCAHCICGDFPYCEEKEELLSEKQMIWQNRCTLFHFCDIAADNPDLRYKPKNRKQRLEDAKQLQLELD